MIFKKIIPFEQLLKVKCIVAQNGKYESISSVKQRTGADIVINAPIYDMTTYKILSRFDCDGKSYGLSQNPTWGIGFPNENKKPIWTWNNGAKCENYVSPYSYLIINEKMNDGLRDTAKRGRTALGLTPNGLAVYMVSDNDSQKCSTSTLCQRMKDMGCVNAINLDGGGSSQAFTPDGNYNSGRKVAGYICIWLKQTADIPKTDTPKEETKKMKICLDAGHGIETSGKQSPDGTYKECEFNLDIANRMNAHLKRCGFDVVMTRTGVNEVAGSNDTSKLQTRCTTSNNAKADLFVSLHSNSSASTTWDSARGWEIYICGLGGNAEKLAKQIQTETVKLGVKNRGIKTANYYVLKNTNAPAVLIEHGFHNNLEDLAMLKSSEWREKFAIANVKGICNHTGVKWIDAPVSKPEVPTTHWYDAAQKWVVANKIADGTRPTENVTRAEVWQMLMNMEANK